MKKLKLLAVMAMVLMAAVVAFPPGAHALATLYLSDGVNVVTVQDNLGGDTNLLWGVVSYNGPIGAWIIDVTTGITKPIIGGAVDAAMDLNSVNVSSGVPTMLTLMFSEIGFTLPIPNTQATMYIGGTTDGTLTYAAYFDTTNALGIPAIPGTATMIGLNPMGPFGLGAFSGTSINPTNTGIGQFSLTQVATMAHAGGPFQISSFNAKLDVVPIPLPASVLLLGTGLLGLVGLGWRRRKES